MPRMTRRYFDWAATSPPDPAILTQALSLSIDAYANPSSRHADGRAARALLEDARSRCASVLSVAPESLAFTSGGTESNNLALLSCLSGRERRGLLVSAAEHPSIAVPAARLKRLGVEVESVRPERDGRISPETLHRAVLRHPGASLVAVMAVNNETGAVNDIPALVQAVRDASGRKPVRFHCDAVQAIGKTPVELRAWGVDSASFSAHKIGGPRGVGLLYAAKPFETVYSGGEQERGLRPGTENVFGALAFAAALEAYGTGRTVAEAGEAAARRGARLIGGLRRVAGFKPIPSDRADVDERFSPYILQAAFSGIPGEVFVRAMDDLGFSVSTGSACSSSSRERPVLAAMGVDKTTALEAVRFSQGRATGDGDIEALIETVRGCVGSLR